MTRVVKIRWLEEPEDHDYDAAKEFLSLRLGATRANGFVLALIAAEMTQRKAKDILRASGVKLLPLANKNVARDVEKVRKGIKLSPILLVAGSEDRLAIIADGYHRTCAVYHLGEDEPIPCKIGGSA